MGSAISSLTAPSPPPPPQSPGSPPDSSPDSSRFRSVNCGVGRLPYPPPESHRDFGFEHDTDDDGTKIKDEPMSDILPSIEEEEEDEPHLRAEHLGDGIVRFFKSEGDMLDDDDDYSYDTIDEDDRNDSYDANESYADLNIKEKRQFEFRLEAAEKPAEEDFDYEAFMEGQRKEAIRMVEKGWKADTVELYMLIERRRYEILFPDSWRSQFLLFPPEIFSDRTCPDKCLLGSLTDKRDTTMKWAITKFLEMAPRVRDNMRPDGYTYYKRRPEALVEQHIKHYAKMIYKDAGLERDVHNKYIPQLFTFASAPHGTPLDILDPKSRPKLLELLGKLEVKLIHKLRRRAHRVLNLLHITKDTPVECIDAAKNAGTLFKYEDEYFLCEPPTLYGIMNVQTVSGLVAYEPLVEKEGIRQMAFFHLSNDVYDVWNCIALALMVIWCRDHMLDMKAVLPDRSGEMETDLDDKDL